MAFILSHHAGETVNTIPPISEPPKLIRIRFYNAHETTVVEEFAIALLCGDVRCDVSRIFLAPYRD